jgi:thiamine-monophosphate kinase
MPGQELLLTTDLLTEGVDFRLADTMPEAIGFKAMGVNLSDIAAMAGEPVAALVGLVLPRSGAPDLAERLEVGLRQLAKQHQVPIIGGDTNVWDGGLVLAVTVLGLAMPPGPVRRSGAQVGDAICVTGPLGGSLLGRHLSPQPRLTEARSLHRTVTLHAMADISDGLAADLGHILQESGCGAELVASQIPIHPDAVRRAAQTGQTPLHHALHDGEDFELVFTVSPADAVLLASRGEAIIIGSCVEAGLWLRQGEVCAPLAAQGWEHHGTGN